MEKNNKQYVGKKKTDNLEREKLFDYISVDKQSTDPFYVNRVSEWRMDSYSARHILVVDCLELQHAPPTE